MFLNINCKQFMFRNIPFLIFIVEDFSLKNKSASSNICAKSTNSRWMKMAKIGLPKGSGKRLKVREKSVKSPGILKWILSGNPVSMYVYMYIKTRRTNLRTTRNLQYCTPIIVLGFMSLSSSLGRRPSCHILVSAQ